MNLAEPLVDIPALSQFLESVGSYHHDLVFTPRSLLKGGTLLLYHSSTCTASLRL